ncbi:MAG: hypothetical protein JRJ71_15895 [Deltaproteobacteria bacterium]|nr:hypothetical protein [Deltaproteobacteria bacterium]
MFCIRSKGSGKPFVQCFPCERQQALFEGHIRAFRFAKARTGSSGKKQHEKAPYTPGHFGVDNSETGHYTQNRDQPVATFCPEHESLRLGENIFTHAAGMA